MGTKWEANRETGTYTLVDGQQVLARIQKNDGLVRIQKNDDSTETTSWVLLAGWSYGVQATLSGRCIEDVIKEATELLGAHCIRQIEKWQDLYDALHRDGFADPRRSGKKPQKAGRKGVVHAGPVIGDPSHTGCPAVIRPIQDVPSSGIF